MRSQWPLEGRGDRHPLIKAHKSLHEAGVCALHDFGLK
jgi:hypothetical protein